MARSSAFILLLLITSLYSQQDMGIITGVVTDASAATIPGARVTVRDPATNEVRTLETNESGTYAIGPMRIGSYEVTVEKGGFKRSVWSDIQVHSQDRVRVDVQLEIGQTSDTVTVTSAAPVLQVETASLAHVVGEREVRGLPLNGRNFRTSRYSSETGRSGNS